MDHLEPVRNRIRAATVAPPLPPWTQLAVHAVGGLTEVGFADDSDLLLVVSSQGRGVIDCLTGELVARDRTEPNDGWHDERRLRAFGIGPLEGRLIRLAGLHGGGLLNCGRDGWWVDAITLDWPDVNLLLGGPWGWIYDGTTPFVKLAVEREVRAFGFSDTGETFVIATSSDIAVFAWRP
ncbi:MAG: hypothetical protein KDA44_23725 [Planctomycetales bacterium]|nr:hypothetical protein [Planctomycetales bacterium]